jgi:hypothetical protein
LATSIIKGKIYPVPGHEGPEGGRVQLCCFFNVDSRRRWMVNNSLRPLYPTVRDPVTIVQESGSAPAPVWTGAENFAPTGIRSPHRPACRESLYRLRYPCLVLSYISVYVLNSNSFYTWERGRNTVVNAGTRLRAGRSWVRFQSGTRLCFPLLQFVQTSCRAHPASYSIGTGCSFPGCKAVGD